MTLNRRGEVDMLVLFLILGESMQAFTIKYNVNYSPFFFFFSGGLISYFDFNPDVVFS